MKTQVLAAIVALLAASHSHAFNNPHAGVVHRRQATSSSSSSSSTSSTTSTTQTTSSSSSATTQLTSSVATSTTTSAATVSSAPLPPAAGTGIPPIQNITSGMPAQTTLPVTATFAAGASPPISGAPALPTPFVFSAADWPAQDQVPQTNSEQVQAWMKELDGWDIPDLNPTADGSCVGDPVAASSAASRGWWTCGGYTRPVDIVACPDKLTWGVSFDDGPSPFTQTLLNFLTTKNLIATFFVVGSRVIERPLVLVEEYMAGHDISVHTWSHRPLTSLTNEQIVAELGWTRHAINKVLGVTPTTMRPPFGDIDDRVRAISLAMGMVPIIWTRGPDGNQYDTNDWRVAGGLVNGTQSLQAFDNILGNASISNTGFIVLQHDLFAITVDLAIGYFLPAALSHNPAFTLEPISKCMKMPAADMYLESTTNTTFPVRNQTLDVNGDGSPDDGSTSSGGSANGGSTYSVPVLSLLLAASTAAVISTLL